MNYFILTFIFYLQNYIASYISSTDFNGDILEFIFLFSIILLISKIKQAKIVYYLFTTFYFFQFSYLNYFGKTIQSNDIYLFVTHLQESFETIYHYNDFLIWPLIFYSITLFFIYKIKIEQSTLDLKVIILTIIISFYFITKFQDHTLIFLKEFATINTQNNAIIQSQSNLRDPIKHNQLNIILVIGESMRAKEYLAKKTDFFEKYPYKTIFSGATNTDISIPLLLNGADHPKEIDLSNNLFRLAKQNNFTTHFISAQNKGYLKYIEPYLDQKSIQNYKILGSKNDQDLMAPLRQIDLNRSNFIVLQMQGEHSPYIYAPNILDSDSLQTKYQKSLDFSFMVLDQIVTHIKEDSKNKYLFIFTSDHGEQIGENGHFGHNKFEPEIYRVPFVLTSSSTLDITNIESHNDIYHLLESNLGYKNTKKDRSKIRVNGTMMSEEDGFREF